MHTAKQSQNSAEKAESEIELHVHEYIKHEKAKVRYKTYKMVKKDAKKAKFSVENTKIISKGCEKSQS